MKKFLKPLIAGGLALSALGASAAMAADHQTRRSQSGVSLTISVGDDGYYDRGHGRYDRRDRYDRYDNRGRRNGYRNGRVVNREVFDTRYRARIILTEQVVRSRHGPRLVCTVDARGPQSHRVPNKRLRKIARRECSHRAEVRIIT